MCALQCESPTSRPLIRGLVDAKRHTESFNRWLTVLTYKTKTLFCVLDSDCLTLLNVKLEVFTAVWREKVSLFPDVLQTKQSINQEKGSNIRG